MQADLNRKTETIEKLQDYWGVRSSSYSRENLEEMNSWKREAWRKQILDAAPKKERLDILDIGTGPGFFAINLALAGHNITAIDVTEGMLDRARENAQAYNADIDFQLQNGENLPFKDNSFDLITSRNVLWNIKNPIQALNEWKRVLRPGGRMVYFDANWYLYLYDSKLKDKKMQAEKSWSQEYPFVKTTVIPKERQEFLEKIAMELPLSREQRPEWDIKILKELKLELIDLQKDIGKNVFEEQEQCKYRATPLFMMCAEKSDAAL
jgi:ubiquinone/menaquinone biosynthesis C-methylase UbiE